jgi:hypothetical protein
LTHKLIYARCPDLEALSSSLRKEQTLEAEQMIESIKRWISQEQRELEELRKEVPDAHNHCRCDCESHLHEEGDVAEGDEKESGEGECEGEGEGEGEVGGLEGGEGKEKVATENDVNGD